eukprot:gene13201-19036_t
MSCVVLAGITGSGKENSMFVERYPGLLHDTARLIFRSTILWQDQRDYGASSSAIHRALTSGFNLVIDACNLHPEHRRAWIQMVHQTLAMLGTRMSLEFVPVTNNEDFHHIEAAYGPGDTTSIIQRILFQSGYAGYHGYPPQGAPYPHAWAPGGWGGGPHPGQGFPFPGGAAYPQPMHHTHARPMLKSQDVAAQPSHPPSMTSWHDQRHQHDQHHQWEGHMFQEAGQDRQLAAPDSADRKGGGQGGRGEGRGGRGGGGGRGPRPPLPNPFADPASEQRKYDEDSPFEQEDTSESNAKLFFLLHLSQRTARKYDEDSPSEEEDSSESNAKQTKKKKKKHEGDSAKDDAPGVPKQDNRIILLFDLNGTLTSHTSKRRSAGVNQLRHGLRELARLKDMFRLGIYTSSTLRTVTTVKQMLEDEVGIPDLFEPKLVLFRDHTAPIPRELMTAENDNWDTVKPLEKWFSKLHRVVLFDDDTYKQCKGEESSMVVVPCWVNEETECKALPTMVDAVIEVLGASPPDKDVRDL